MSLRGKVLLVMTIGFLTLVLVLGLVSRFILIRGFVDLEKTVAARDLKRAHDAFVSELNTMDVILVDWAQWDDTYEFVQKPYDDYIKSNLVDETFEGLRLNFMLFFDRDGNLVFSKGFDLEARAEMAVPSSLMEHLKPSSPLIRFVDEKASIKGVLLLPEGPLLLASRPVLTSEEEGPIAGTMVMARFFDQSEVERLAELIKMNLSFYRVDDVKLPEPVREALGELKRGREEVIKPLSGNELACYLLINDVYGEPALIMELRKQRNLFAQGLRTVQTLMGVLIASYLLFVGFGWLLLDRWVVSRIVRLSRGVQKVRQEESLSSTRFEAKGSDEICSLAREINEMLDSLDRYVKEVKKANEYKSEFVSMVAHELRNPMTNIEGYTDLVLRGRAGPINDRQREFLMKVRSNVERMSKLVEDLLNISRIEAGKIKLELAPVDLKEVIREVSEDVLERFKDKGLEFSIEIPDSLPLVKADRARVIQILSNLLVNAFSYTPAGRVTLRVHPQEDGFVRVDVVDTGVGIPLEEQGRIFQPFFRGSNPEVRSRIGTGLGLTITKSLVELMGGRIWFESTPGKGSTFSFTLPVTEEVVKTL